MISPMENKPLIIPESKRWKGLKVFCYECGTVASDICKKTGKPITQCKNGDKHVFKVVVHVPGSKNQRRTKNLLTRDVNKAIQEAIEFEKLAKSKEYEKENIKNEQPVNEQPTDNRPYLLIHALARYVSWLANEGVPAHLRKTRSPEHIKDVQRVMVVLVASLKAKEYNLETTTVGDINNTMVGKVFEYLEGKKLAPRTFNKYFGFFTSWLKWYAEEYDVPIRNYFEKVPRKNLNPRPQAIIFHEYKALLRIITAENGIKTYKGGVKPIRNLYRPWLADAIRMGLESGRRREEIINMKWKDLFVYDDQEFIKVEDYKVNRIQNRIGKDEKKFIDVPVTKSLKKLLDELGRTKYMESDNYILAPEIKMSRKRVMADVLSRGFSHYYDQLNTGKKLTFKSLRKTYITAVDMFIGHGNTKVITGHTNDKILDNNYIDSQMKAKVAGEMEIFPENEERANELNEVRSLASDKEKNQIIRR